MLRYIFSYSVHNLTNVSSDDANLILVGRLFQITTPEYEKLPLYKLLLLWYSVLFTVESLYLLYLLVIS